MLLTTENARESNEPEAEGSDRRRGLRIRQSRPIKVYEPTSCRFIGGQTEDVSVTGLRIQMPRSAALREGATVSVHVGLDGVGQPLANRREMMPARVVWVDRQADPLGTSLWAGIEWVASLAAHLNAA
jgi:hypothetical protein